MRRASRPDFGSLVPLASQRSTRGHRSAHGEVLTPEKPELSGQTIRVPQPSGWQMAAGCGPWIILAGSVVPQSLHKVRGDLA